MIGDGPQLLTHYYDDARTMYQVFRRGLSISGERGRGGVQELWQGVSRCKGQQWGGGWPGTRGLGGEWCPGSEEKSYCWLFSHPVGEVAALCGQRADLSFVLALRTA